MPTNSSAPVTQDIWHLSIDDLLSPLPEKPRLGGSGPFVINLSSSTAGIGLPTLNLAGCDSAHAYEIQRHEDGRTRYRLRLGPFETEDEADLILSVVREIYPSALSATAAPDDLKAISVIRAKASATADARRPPVAPAPLVAQPVVAQPKLPVVAKRPEPPVVTERVEMTPAKVLLAPRIATAAVLPVVTQRAEPAKPTSFNPNTAKPSMSVSAPLVRRAVPPPKAPVAKSVAAAPSKQPSPAPAPRTEKRPSLDSTQTMRPLTPTEIEDASRPCFVIELATSGEAFDPDTVPNLDIFGEYRLYSVAETGKSSIVHALRVGFFSAEVAAKAVASYLGQYYDKPAIKRVSVAERARFAEQIVEARKDVGATGRHAVIEITDDLIARRKRFDAKDALPPV